MAQTNIRSLDHVVLPVAGLGVARERLASLGFTVAPDGHHPFGTSNCCVYLADGTFLEPLAVTDTTTAQRAVAEQNVFVARDQAYRRDHPDDGFSAIVLASYDALADNADYVDAGVSAGPVLDFSRPFIDASGNSDAASFRLAFAAEAQSSEFFLFTCQRVRVPSVDRSALQQHKNSVLRLAGIRMEAKVPAQHRAFLEAAFGRGNVSSRADALDIRLTSTKISFKSGGSSPGLQASALVFACGNPGETKSVLEANGVTHYVDGQQICVPAAPGQGAQFIFESDQ